MLGGGLNPEDVAPAVEELKRQLAAATQESSAAHLALARVEAREGQLLAEYQTLREHYACLSSKYLNAKVRDPGAHRALGRAR